MSIAGGSGAGAPERLLSVDALRALAMIAVVVGHLGWISGPHWYPPVQAVDLFFMISGLVIGYVFEPKLLAGMTFRTFMTHRLVRLYPCLLLGLAVSIGVHLVYPVPRYEIGWHSLGHFVLLPDLFAPGIFPLNGVFWTLFFEIAINAVHAAVVHRLTTARLAAFTLLAGIGWATAAVAIGDWGAGWNGGTFLVGIMRVSWGYGAGLLLYRLFLARGAAVPRLPFWLVFGASAILLLVPNLWTGAARNVASVFLLLPALLVLSTATALPVRARGLVTWLTDISYPLYALHLPLLILGRNLIGSDGPMWIWGAITVGLFAAGTAAAYGFDMPLRSWLRTRLPVHRNGAPAPALKGEPCGPA